MVSVLMLGRHQIFRAHQPADQLLRLMDQERQALGADPGLAAIVAQSYQGRGRF